MNPARPPRPLPLHWVVDSAVAFCVIVVVALFFSVSIWVIVAVALVSGAVAAPLTRRAEIRALAARDDEDRDA